MDILKNKETHDKERSNKQTDEYDLYTNLVKYYQTN